MIPLTTRILCTAADSNTGKTESRILSYSTVNGVLSTVLSDVAMLRALNALELHGRLSVDAPRGVLLSFRVIPE